MNSDSMWSRLVTTTGSYEQCCRREIVRDGVQENPNMCCMSDGTRTVWQPLSILLMF